MQGVRLQKMIAQAGVTSRRKAEALIAGGRVAVNGHLITTPGVTVDPETDVVVVDGRRLSFQTSLHYVLLHKPKGYVTTCDDEQGRPIVFDLLKPYPGRLFPVGRLDVNTEGVLLLTNDGEMANRLLHPRYRIPRVYVAKIQGVVSTAEVERLRQGVRLEDGKTLPARVEVLRLAATNCTLRLTLYEGRHRQIHRMLDHCGSYRIKRLQRVAMGPLALAGLPLGQSRRLEAHEIERLRQVCQLQRGGQSDGPPPFPPQASATRSPAKKAPAKPSSIDRKRPSTQGSRPLIQGRKSSSWRKPSEIRKRREAVR